MSDQGSLSDLEDAEHNAPLPPAPPNEGTGSSEINTDPGTQPESHGTGEDGETNSDGDSEGQSIRGVDEDEKKLDELDDEGEEEDNFKKCAALLCILCCFLFFVIIGLLIFFFRPDPQPLGRAQLDPYTDSPTPLFTTPIPTDSPVIPTENPTLSPTRTGETPRPTGNPTEIPTPAPTLVPFELPTTVSRLPCSQIRLTEGATEGNFGDNNFKLQLLDDGTEVCGDTYGPDPERPNRNPWSVRIGRRDCDKYNFTRGTEICDSVGARWCTVEEFDQEIAHGTGCGGDRELVYTDSDCTDTNTGLPGKIMFDVGLRDSRKPFYECQTNMSTLSLARCCGDVY